MKIFFTKKNIESWVKENQSKATELINKYYPTEIKQEEPPKHTTRRALMEVTLINNKTDKEYRILSINDFGLKWNWITDNDNRTNYELLTINQLHSVNEADWYGVGRFVDFSILNTVFKTFDITQEEEK